MRTRAVALLLALAACGAGSEPTEVGPTVGELQQRACAEVREGIDAFNRQDYSGTVEKFTDAERHATAYAAESQSQEAEDLLEAVIYYADLTPEDYPEAARSSKDFARYKSITLGQCTDGTPIDEPDETLT